jgi:hypothetical protein
LCRLPTIYSKQPIEAFSCQALHLALCNKTKKMEDNQNQPQNQRSDSHIIGGILIIAVGAALLLRNTGFPLPYWLFTWPMLLIVIGVYNGFKHNFKNSGWIFMIAIGVFFLIDKFIPGIRLTPYFWPFIIIGLGVIFIIRPKGTGFTSWNNFNPPPLPRFNNATESKNTSFENTAFTNSSFTDSNSVIKINSIFSGIEKNVVSKNFQGGKIVTIFGGANVDLSQAEIQGTIHLKMDVIFGGIKLVIPPHWTVYNEIDGVFHGVDDKRKYHSPVTVDPQKILVLKGSVLFGGLEIRSY